MTYKIKIFKGLMATIEKNCNEFFQENPNIIVNSITQSFTQTDMLLITILYEED